MRDIKFRAWDEKTSRIHQVNHIDNLSNSKSISVWTNEIEGGYHFNPSALEQFTGLYDKNGTEIYEGDIVKIVGLFGFEFTGEVVYDRFGFNLKNFWCSGFDDPDLAFSEEHDWEVIGNIHENPELLEVVDGK